MEELETAIKYGVPTPQTCKELDWKDETFFNWFFDPSSESFILCNDDSLDLGLNFYAPAPQMHEIADKLPTHLVIDESDFYLELKTYSKFNKSSWHYIQYINRNRNKCLFDIYKPLEKSFAQAYAEMYITLRNEMLLKTTLNLSTFNELL